METVAKRRPYSPVERKALTTGSKLWFQIRPPQSKICWAPVGCRKVLKQGRVRLRAALVQGFAGWDGLEPPALCADRQEAPACVPLGRDCARGTEAPASVPLRIPSRDGGRGWSSSQGLPHGLMKPETGLSCQAPGPQQFPYQQVPRDR